MNDLQIKHLRDDLAEALATITKLKGDVVRLEANVRYHNDVKPVERSGDYQRVVGQLADKREELTECHRVITRRDTSVELWKKKFVTLKNRIEKLTKELNEDEQVST